MLDKEATMQMKRSALRTALADIINLIRFPTMTAEKFTDTVVPLYFLTTEEIRELYKYTLSKNVQANMLLPVEKRKPV